MWVSKPVYESVPFLYMAVGVCAAAAAFFIGQEPWRILSLLVGLVFVTGGLVLWLKRRDYRTSRSRTAFHKTL
jgi:Flp pilus assembly protein TadB